MKAIQKNLKLYIAGKSSNVIKTSVCDKTAVRQISEVSGISISSCITASVCVAALYSLEFFSLCKMTPEPLHSAS